MSLMCDRREELGSVPAAHALVVGVGQYSQRLPSLGTSVRSAAAIASWLLANDLAVPLSTCRLLVSPPETAHLEGPGIASPATIDQFLQAATEWRQDARSNRENIALFYFCGHGFQRSNAEDLMLFEDFDNGLGPALRAAVSVDNLFQGMAPGRETEEIARTQLYFIDISRTQVTTERYQLSKPTMIFDEYRSGPDDRSAVIFYSTQPGEHSFEKMDEIHSVFTNVLLRCLDGEAAAAIEPSRWGITINSLIHGLGTAMLKYEWPGSIPKQVPVVGGLVRDHVIRYLNSPPVTDLTVYIQNALGPSTLEVENSQGIVVHSAVISPAGNVRLALPSGFYAIRANDQERSLKASTIASLQPGSSNVHLTMKS